MNVHLAWLLAITVMTMGVVIIVHLGLKYQAKMQKLQHDHEILKD